MRKENRNEQETTLTKAPCTCSRHFFWPQQLLCLLRLCQLCQAWDATREGGILRRSWLGDPITSLVPRRYSTNLNQVVRCHHLGCRSDQGQDDTIPPRPLCWDANEAQKTIPLSILPSRKDHCPWSPRRWPVLVMRM